MTNVIPTKPTEICDGCKFLIGSVPLTKNVTSASYCLADMTFDVPKSLPLQVGWPTECERRELKVPIGKIQLRFVRTEAGDAVVDQDGRQVAGLQRVKLKVGVNEINSLTLVVEEYENDEISVSGKRNSE